MNNELKTRLSAEAGIHKALSEFAQSVFDEYGIQLHSVNIDWWDVSDSDKRKFMVSAVRADTTMAAGTGGRKCLP